MKVVNLCVSLLVLSFIVACQPKTTSSDQLADEVYQVDSLLFLQDSLIGDTVELEGFCIDVCGHGGSHITLMEAIRLRLSMSRPGLRSVRSATT